MERVGFLLKVKTARLDEYKQIHKAVWPELLEIMRRAGWRNYSLFLSEDGWLFGYFETPDFARALAELEKTDASKRWETMMAPFFEDFGDRRGHDAGFVRLEEVFHLD